MDEKEGIVEIKQADFDAYEDCRLSGVTNMFMVSRVMEITGLRRTQIAEIMKNYNIYKDEYN